MHRHSSGKYVSALLVGSYDADRLLLHDVFRAFDWRLFEAPDRRRAMQCLTSQPVQVVIAQNDMPQWNWRTLLHDLRGLVCPPQLIVTAPTADHSLWAEVLNVGAYDLLAQPLVREEIERVILSARREYDRHLSAGAA